MRKRMRNAALVSKFNSKRPFVETDSLVTDFDSFYIGVVKRQLIKDKL